MRLIMIKINLLTHNSPKVPKLCNVMYIIKHKFCHVFWISIGLQSVSNLPATLCTLQALMAKFICSI